MQWALNYSGPFTLTRCLHDALLRHSTNVLVLTSTSHCTPNSPLDFSKIGVREPAYNGWTAYQQSRLAAILLSSQLNRRFKAMHSEAISVAVCESDKWFYMPQLLLEEDKQELAVGPLTSVLALVQPGVALGGLYLVDGKEATPSEHATSEQIALKLWEISLNR